MKYFIRLMILLTLISGLACSNSGSNSPAAGDNTQGNTGLDGAYYSAQVDSVGSGYSPERLDVFAEGSVKNYSVHNGATIIQTIAYTVVGNKINIPALVPSQSTYLCNGFSVTQVYNETPASSMTYQRVDDSLVLQGADFKITLKAATPAETTRIIELPTCVKQ